MRSLRVTAEVDLRMEVVRMGVGVGAGGAVGVVDSGADAADAAATDDDACSGRRQQRCPKQRTKSMSQQFPIRIDIHSSSGIEI